MSHLNAQTIFLGVLFPCVFVAVVYFIVRSQIFAAALLLFVFSLTDAVRDQIGLSVILGGFRVSAMDTLCLVLLAVGAYRALINGIHTALQGAVIALVLLLLFHFVRGVADFGFQPATNSTREWLYFLAPLLFAATVPNPWGERAWHLIVITGLLLVLVAIPYLLTEGIHSSSRLVVRNGQLIAARPITASGALVILEAAILLLTLRWPSRRASSHCAAIAVGGVLVLQHRTVWVAALAVALVGFVAWSRANLPRAERLVFGATGVVLLVTPLAVLGFLANGSFRASLAETTASHSTFAWRTQSWQELISTHHSALNIATGGPAGASWARTIGGLTATQAPHSAFVDAYLRFGAPGVALFGGLLLALWVKRRGVSPRTQARSAAGLILIALALYSIAYALGPVQGLILGALVSSLSLRAARGDALARVGVAHTPRRRVMAAHR